MRPGIPYGLVLLTINCVTLSAQDLRFQQNIDAWTTQDTRNPPPEDAILFLGGSVIRFWESLTRDFSDYNVIQRGFGGGNITLQIQYVEDIVLPYDPAAIVMSGAPSNEEGFNEFKKFFDLVHAGQDQDRPPIPILVSGAIPSPFEWPTRWNEREPGNKLVEEFAANNDAIHYIDLPSRFLDLSPAPGEPPPEHLFAQDTRLLSQEGYDILQSEVSAILNTVIPPNKIFNPNPHHPPSGKRILFDFGRPNLPTASPDENGNHWNNWHSDTGVGVLPGQSIGNLITTEGNETGIDLIITGEFAAEGPGLRAPDANLLSDLAVEKATIDSFIRPFFSTGPGSSSGEGALSAGFMLTGLDPDAAFDFRFFASRRARDEHSTQYSVVGSDEPVVGMLKTSEADAATNQNMDTTLLISGIQPDELGQIFVDLQPDEMNNDTYIGIMEITVVPEPATFGSIVVCCLLLCLKAARMRPRSSFSDPLSSASTARRFTKNIA